MRVSQKALLATVLLTAPTAAIAHPALYHHTHTFMMGVTHPLTGLDHLLAMLAVGLLAGQTGGRAAWLWPASFVTAMIAGGVLGMTGFALPLIEPAIAASLLVLGLMIATMTELPLTAGIGLIAVFGLFHGNAHGLEAPLNGSGLLYGLGFTLSTISLHIAGLSLGFATKGRAQILLRAGAALIAVTGGVLFFHMIPGEILPAEGGIILNEGRAAITMQVANTGDRPVQVGSHYHFFEANSLLHFDRDKARGMRLDVPAGSAVRFEPGQMRDVNLVPYAGDRIVYGFHQKIMGKL